mgnify:CR=1 FL=1
MSKRLAENEITVSFSDDAITKIAEEGFDKLYGARPLRREIQNRIEDALSERILDSTIKTGDSVLCSYINNEFNLSPTLYKLLLLFSGMYFFI